MENQENMIDFVSGKHSATVSFTNGKHIRRIKAIHEERADEFKFYCENEDGSVCATIPLKWIKINPGSKPDPDKPKRELSPEQRERLLEALAKGRAIKKAQQEK